MQEENKSKCGFCNGNSFLAQRGIMSVYLFPCKISLSLIVLGIVLGLFFVKYWLTLSVIGFFIPLANADLRLYIYPFVAVAKLFGKKINCPKCTGSGRIFK